MEKKNQVKKSVTKKRIEYLPVTSEKQIIVRFNMSQLQNIVNQLRKSGAQEIGVPIIPMK